MVRKILLALKHIQNNSRLIVLSVYSKMKYLQLNTEMEKNILKCI